MIAREIPRHHQVDLRVEVVDVTAPGRSQERRAGEERKPARRAGRVHRLIESSNSLLLFVPRIFASRNSIASLVFKVWRSSRKIQTRLSSFSSIKSSSLRV